MGTLFNQPVRNYRTVTQSELDHSLSEFVKLATKYGISVSEVIATKQVLELERKNDLYVSNGDAFDEQIAGIGKLLQQLSIAIESLREE